MARKRLDDLLPKSPFSSYDVGYCKPPAAHRFKAGQSGNPGGRRRGDRDKRPWFESRLTEIVLEQADRRVKVNKGKRQIAVRMAEAIAIRPLLLPNRGSASVHIASMRSFDLIVGVCDDCGTYRCCWQSSPAGRVAQSTG